MAILSTSLSPGHSDYICKSFRFSAHPPSLRSFAILSPFYLRVQSFPSFKCSSSACKSPQVLFLPPSSILVTVFFLALHSSLFEENTSILFPLPPFLVPLNPSCTCPLLPSAHFLIPGSSNGAVFFPRCEAQHEPWQTPHEEMLVDRIPNQP